MRMNLTDQAINKATRDAKADGKRRELADAGSPGLRIRITPTGGRAWILGARDKLGRARRFPLGSYPNMGIADARTAARAMHHGVKHDGVDPIADKRRNVAIGKLAKAGVGTLRALLDAYGQSADAPKSWGPGRPRVETVFRKVLDQPCAMLAIADLQLAADAYPFPKSAAFAVRTLRPVLKWASQPGRAYVSRDLTLLVTPATIEARKRVLHKRELQAVLPHLRCAERPHARMLRLLLLTLTRREEAGSATWGNIDLESGTWTIPVTKNGEPHVVPLSRQAKELLTAIGPGGDADLVFCTPTGVRLGNWDRETKRIILASGLGTKDRAGAVVMKDGSPLWTRHDLRRTGATLLGELGVLPDLIEAALNHVAIRSPLAATYNRNRYRPQVAEALQRLADELDRIEGIDPALAA